MPIESGPAAGSMWKRLSQNQNPSVVGCKPISSIWTLNSGDGRGCGLSLRRRLLRGKKHVHVNLESVYTC